MKYAFEIVRLMANELGILVQYLPRAISLDIIRNFKKISRLKK